MSKFLKYFHCPVLLFLVLIGSQCCKPQLANTIYLESYTVDGDDTEWDFNNYKKVKEHNIVYAIAKNEKSLLLLIKGMDEEAVRRMFLLGITIWVDGKGKKRKRQGIVYPQGILDKIIYQKMISRQMKMNFEEESLNQNPEMPEILKRNKNNMGLIGFIEDSGELFVYPKDELNLGVEAEIMLYGKKEAVYEISIPLHLLQQGKKGIVGVGFETHTIDVKEMMQQRLLSRGQSSPRMMQRRGAGRAGRRGSSQMIEKAQKFKAMNEPVIVWEKISL